MIKININEAASLINNQDYFDNNSYEVVYYTIYYENESPKQLRRSTFDNITTEYPLEGAIALTIVRLEYDIIDNEIQCTVKDKTIDVYEIVR